MTKADPFTILTIVVVMGVQVMIWLGHFFTQKWRVPNLSRQTLASFFLETASGTVTALFGLCLSLSTIGPWANAQAGEVIEAKTLTDFFGSIMSANAVILFIIGVYVLISVFIQMLRLWDGDHPQREPRPQGG
ncbi:MAG: hypothetical protein M9939_02025 [Mesorhizobium sp.]|nr:hypothetical protein [Mesorhizobium sp.]MCO5159888.1 hypothetical protein [Mesorhizobium sp.]